MDDQPKYPKELISAIAQKTDMGMICFLNTDTMEFDCVLGESSDAYWSDELDDLYQEVYNKVNSWEHTINIEPFASWQSYEIMERFIEDIIPGNDAIKTRLRNAISGRKPFQNFKFIIDNSQYRQSWFDFKQSQLEQFVQEQLF